ncbi:MAG: SDR family NAD(P)-dependent oxidoreductase [Deltaproteobacteria bacterium]|nr:MAG: SDR family NAD(P)-dependent oxidoreductase [Deltaproteobacteria bacterium]
MFWKDKKVFVTGACGFIGSHLAEKLVTEGASVKALVQYNSFNNWGWLDTSSQAKSMEIVAGDIRDHHQMTQLMRRCDYVFHLAALIAIPYSYQAPSCYVDTNISGTLNILQAARAHSLQRVIHTSTSEVYGTAQYTPIDEKHPLQGQSPYSASKIGADMLAESFFRSFELPVVTVRPFNTYGPRQSARAFIPTIISQILSHQPEIHLGALSPIRDLTFVTDTVCGFLKAAEAQGVEGETINLGTGEGFSVGDVLDKIMTMTQCRSKITEDTQRIRPEKSEVLKLISNNQKALTRLGWKPSVTLDEGLKKTIEWFERNKQYYKPFQYNV